LLINQTDGEELSYVYFIRHAQAGTRDNYDVLSDLGREQARLLGEHLVEHRVELGAIISGDMRRQRETAQIAAEALSQAGLAPAEVTVDSRWNEFSLISVYRAISARMIEQDPEFARDFKEMQEAIRCEPHATGGATGRCDAAVIRAWMENRYAEYQGESWADFKARIRASAGALDEIDSGRALAVFTSATPVAIQTALALDLPDEGLLKVLGVIYNSSITVLRRRNGDSRLLSFNSTPHLAPTLRTFR
jgi:broad specificity phosphatase PhoE